MYYFLRDILVQMEFPIYGTLFYGPYCNFYKLRCVRDEKLEFVCLGGGPLYFDWVMDALTNVKKYALSVPFFVETQVPDEYDSMDEEESGIVTANHYILISSCCAIIWIRTDFI
jgi:hypothetical protein